MIEALIVIAIVIYIISRFDTFLLILELIFKGLLGIMAITAVVAFVLLLTVAMTT